MKKAMDAKGIDWQSAIILAIFAAVFLGGFFLMARQAYRHTQANSPEAKTRFQEEFPGLEAAAGLQPEMKRRVIEHANKEFCSCRCGYTVAACLNIDSKCPNRPKNLAEVERLIEQARQRATTETAQ